jgi:hypothetical protein
MEEPDLHFKHSVWLVTGLTKHASQKGSKDPHKYSEQSSPVLCWAQWHLPV